MVHGVLAQLAYLVVFAGRRGPTSPPSDINKLTSVGARRRARPECAAAESPARPGRRAGRPCVVVEPGTDLLDVDVQGSGELGRRPTGVTVWSSSVRTVIHRGPAGVSSPAFRRRSRSLPVTICSHAVGQPPRHVCCDGRHVGAVVRRAQRQHPSYDGVATVVVHEEPRDHPAGGVADHVDRVGRRSGPSCAGPGRRAASPAPAGRPCRPSVGWKATAVRPSRRELVDERGEVTRRSRRTPGPRSPAPSCDWSTAPPPDDGAQRPPARPRPATSDEHQRADDHHQSPTRGRERAQPQPGVSSVAHASSLRRVWPGRPRRSPRARAPRSAAAGPRARRTPP